MKTVASLFAATFLVGGLTTTALGADPYTPPESSSPGVSESSPSSSSGSAAQPGASTSTAPSQGEHTLSGTITAIDQSQGTLSLKTETETLEFHFPPTALQGYTEGDEVTVQLAISPKDDPMKSGGTMDEEGAMPSEGSMEKM